MTDALSQVNTRLRPESGLRAAARPAAREVLRLQQTLGRQVDASDPLMKREAAAQLVSELFFGPLLAEMRRFPFGRDVACGGQTESAFGQQLDQRMADTVAASQPGLVDQFVQYLETARPGGGQAGWAIQQQIAMATGAGREAVDE